MDMVTPAVAVVVVTAKSEGNVTTTFPVEGMATAAVKSITTVPSTPAFRDTGTAVPALIVVETIVKPVTSVFSS